MYLNISHDSVKFKLILKMWLFPPNWHAEPNEHT